MARITIMQTAKRGFAARPLGRGKKCWTVALRKVAPPGLLMGYPNDLAQRLLTDERLRLCDPILDVGVLRQVTQDLADFLR